MRKRSPRTSTATDTYEETDSMHTSLAHLHKAGACKGRYRFLAKSLGGIRYYGKKTPLPYSKILESNELNDCLWALGNGDDDAVWICRLAALAFAMRAERYTNDVRVKELNKTNHLFLHGEESTAAKEAAAWKATRVAGEAARDAALTAAKSAIWNAAGDAMGAAREARDAAGNAKATVRHASSAPASAAMAAARDAERKEQIEILRALLSQMEQQEQD